MVWGDDMDKVIIEGRNLSFKYKDSDDGIFNVDFQIMENEVILVAGDSGSGKSTLLKCINGLIPKIVEGDLKGELFINQQNSLKMPISDINLHIGSVFQNPRSQFFTTNTTSELVFAMENYGYKKEIMHKKLEEIVSFFGIDNLLDKDIFSLSSGEKQLLALASSITLNQKILLFDEPSANLDYKNTFLLKKLIKKLKDNGYTVIVADHRFYYLNDLIDRVFLFEKGNLKIFDSEKAFKNSGYDTRSFNLFDISLPYNVDLTNKEKVLTVEKVCYGELLNNINLEFYNREVVSIVGENGVGKTTLARLLCRSVKPDSGKITGDLPFYIMQDADYQLFGTSVFNELQISKNKVKDKDIEEILAYFNLTAHKDKHPFDISGGQKQRLQIALGILSKCRVVIFDEPTSGLDVDSMKRVAKEINKLKQTAAVVVISHDYEFIRLISNRVICLGEKKIKNDFILDEEHINEFNQLFKEMEEVEYED